MQTTDKPKKGRPPKPADQQTKPYSVRLTDAEINKLKLIGVGRLRAWLMRTPLTLVDRHPKE